VIHLCVGNHFNAVCVNKSWAIMDIRNVLDSARVLKRSGTSNETSMDSVGKRQAIEQGVLRPTYPATAAAVQNITPAEETNEDFIRLVEV
jgi:hypothetical protein